MHSTVPSIALPPELWSIVLNSDTRESQCDLVCKEWRDIMVEARKLIPYGVLSIPNMILWLAQHMMVDNNLLHTFEVDTSSLKEGSRILIQRELIVLCIGSFIDERMPKFTIPHHLSGQIHVYSVSKTVCMKFVDPCSGRVLVSFSCPFSMN